MKETDGGVVLEHVDLMNENGFLLGEDGDLLVDFVQELLQSWSFIHGNRITGRR